MTETASPGEASTSTGLPETGVSGKLKSGLVFAAAFVFLAFIAFVAQTAGELDWFMALATVGTAVGTLGLALYTYRLAQSTQESVSGANRLTDLAYSQLQEVQAQRGLIAEQARKAGLQAEAARRLADSSQTRVTEAAKARIDAIAPLLHMTVALAEVYVLHGRGREKVRLQATDTWYEPQLRDVSFEVQLAFGLTNVGASPALIAHNYTLDGLQDWSERRAHTMALGPGASYHDFYVVRLSGEQAKDGMLLGISLTYDGLLHGEVFDHVQWNGGVRPLKFSDGVAVPNDREWTVNAGGAQVVRSYPNIERPDEMAEARARLLNPSRQAGA